MVNNIKLLFSIPLLSITLSGSLLQAREIDTNIAKMQAMYKITGMVRVINVPVNSEVKYGSFSIVVRACKTRPPEETPENFAFVDVVDNYKSNNPVNIFRGWMISSSPSLNPVEHPIYDIWLLSCENGVVDPRLKIMSAEELKARDNIPQAKALADGEPVDVENIPANLLDGEKEQVDATLANSLPAQTAEMTASQAMEKSMTDEVSTPEVVNTQAKTPQGVVQPENMQNDGIPQALVNIESDEVNNPSGDAEKLSQIPENVPSDNTIPNLPVRPNENVEQQAEVNLSVEENTIEQTVPVAEPLISDDEPVNLDVQTAPIAPEDINLPEDDMLPVEEFEENGMLDDQLIDFSE